MYDTLIRLLYSRYLFTHRMASHNYGISLATAGIVGLLFVAVWIEKTEPHLWQDRLILPNFTQEANRHTPLADAGTFLPPTIVASRTLSASDSPVIIAGQVHIPAGVTVTVNPGTQLLVHEYGYLAIDGTLLVNGTARQRVVFSTNEANVANRAWSGLLFGSGSRGVITHADIRHASPGVTCGEGSNVVIQNTTIELGNLGVFKDSPACRLVNNTILTDAYVRSFEMAQK